ncbi:hypothetical protein R1flu_015944 [Riccia fluitans]|uniref:Uncharacterized protein n=1 Tax=Riccia fluitans TaxID=41844 RepID=A0ABD1YKL4_9MARC
MPKIPSPCQELADWDDCYFYFKALGKESTCKSLGRRMEPEGDVEFPTFLGHLEETQRRHETPTKVTDELDEEDHDVSEAEFQKVLDAWSEILDAEKADSTTIPTGDFRIRDVRAYVDGLKTRRANLKKPKKGPGVYLPLKIEDELDREAFPPGTIIGYIQTPIPGIPRMHTAAACGSKHESAHAPMDNCGSNATSGVGNVD